MTCDVIVAGAGIGGVAAALALAREGLSVQVLERAEGPRPVGAGIGLAPNACALFERWGLYGSLAQRGQQLTTMTVCTSGGRPLSVAPLNYEICGRHYPPLGIHRADLLDVLLERARATGRVGLNWGAGVERFEPHATGARVYDEGGRVHDARVLIGADGIHSRVRAQLHGEEAPRYAGYTCWRGIASGDFDLAGEATEAWGSGRRFGFLPIGGRRVYWFAVENAEPNTRLAGEAARAELLSCFGGAFAVSRVGALIAATPPDAIVHHDILDRPPLAHWGSQRVTLLGDAAHAMTPNLGQGACQAIEDAAALAQAVSAHGTEEAALRDYEARRILRVNPLVERSYGVGRLAQLSHPLLVALRNTAMWLAPSETMHARMARELEAGVAPLLAREPASAGLAGC
ncbi:MAG: FAD-dependent monooxygenase [Myxococcales bacterium]|nr:FAD-dependent monooxygenase [Myxococcales bacterium]